MKFMLKPKGSRRNQQWFGRIGKLLAAGLPIAIFCAAALGPFGAPHAMAATLVPYYWDTNGTTAGAGGAGTPTGTWDTTGGNLRWALNDTGTATTSAWVNGTLGASRDVAHFAASNDATGSYTVTVGSGVDSPVVYVASIDEGNVTFSGGTLTFTDDGSFLSGFSVASGSIATVTGTAIAHSGGNSTFFYKQGAGTLRIGDAASVSQATLVVREAEMDIISTFPGTLQATLLATKAFVLENGGVETNVLQANGTIALGLGSAPGQVRWTNDGGFAARGGDLNIQLNGGVGSVTFGASNFVPSGEKLIFGSLTANDDVYFQNSLNLSTATQTVKVIDNPNVTTDIAWITGNITSATPTSGLIKAGDGTLGLTGNNTFTGAITISGGLLYGNTAAINGSDTTNGISFNNNAILQSGTGGISTGKSVTLTGAGTIDTFGGAITLSGNITGSGVLTKTQTNLLTLSGSGNTFSGGLVVNQGTVFVNNANSGVLGSGNVTLGASFSPVVDLNGKSPTIGLLVGAGSNGSVSNSLAATTSTLTLAGTGSQSYGGLIQDGGAGKVVTLTLSSGTQTLTGNNAYTGATNVNGGTLRVNGNHSGTGAITVANLATLGGTGSLAGAVTVNSGGFFAPGTSIESLGTGNLSMSGTSTFQLEINTSSLLTDLANVTGSFSLAGANTVRLTIVDLGLNVPLTVGTSFLFVDYSTTWNGGLFSLNGSNVLTDDEVFTFGANSYRISYNGVNNATTDVVLQVVPEPGTFAMLLFGTLTLWFVRRSRVGT